MPANSLAKKADGRKSPSLSCSALIRICVTGKKMKVATSAMIMPIATTKTSPLITPRAAMPRVRKNRKAAATSSPP